MKKAILLLRFNVVSGEAEKSIFIKVYGVVSVVEYGIQLRVRYGRTKIQTSMDVASPYKEAITNALRLSIVLIDQTNDTHGQPVICQGEKAKNVNQLPLYIMVKQVFEASTTSLLYSKESV